jgi:prevent-host-death family protein
MAETISLRDANQRFARMMREVEAGTEYVVTRRGRAVARIVPVEPRRRVLTPEQEAAWKRTLARAAEGWRSDGTPFDRDALHER